MLCPLQSRDGGTVECWKDECALFHEGDCAFYVIAEALSTLAANTAGVRDYIKEGLHAIDDRLNHIAATIGAK